MNALHHKSMFIILSLSIVCTPALVCMDDFEQESIQKQKNKFRIQKFVLATTQCNTETIQQMLQEGFNPWCCKALLVAPRADITKMLLENSYDWEDAKIRKNQIDLALAQATKWNNTQQVQLLLDHNAEPYNVPQALCKAATYSADITQLLLDHDADPCGENANNDDPLYCACTHVNNKSAQMLIKAGASINKLCSDDTETLHHWCSRACKFVYDNNMLALQCFVQHGGNLNVYSRTNQGPLHAATASPDMILFLLGNGAHVNQLNAKTKTALESVIESHKPNPQSITYLIQAGGIVTNYESTTDALKKNGFKSEFIEEMADIEKNVCSKTVEPLPTITCMPEDNKQEKLSIQLANEVRACNYNKIEQLLEQKADPNQFAIYGSPIIAYATTVKIACLLIDKGNAKQLNSCLLRAAQKGNKPLVEEMLARNADVNADNDEILTRQIGNSPWDITEILINAKANVNPPHKKHDTPLCNGISNGITLAQMEVLLKKGASVTEDAALAAARRGNPALTHKLVQKGAKFSRNYLASMVRGIYEKHHPDERMYLNAMDAIQSLNQRRLAALRGTSPRALTTTHHNIFTNNRPQISLTERYEGGIPLVGFWQ